MEQKNPKIKLETASTFILSTDELRGLYLRLALSQYRYLRVPDYDEAQLLIKLIDDLKKLQLEAQSLNEEYPNNHNLQRIRAFFDMHYKQLKQITKME